MVATPIKSMLAEKGIDAIVASEEPIPNNANWDPETKIEKLLEQSDCAVVLATPDDDTGKGLTIRNNISDEMARMRSMPHLRNRIQTFKEVTVTLPSNINPTYEHLDLDDLDSVVERILTQMSAWQITEELLPAHRRESPAATDHNRSLKPLDGLKFADYEGTEVRAYELALELNQVEMASMVSELLAFVIETSADSQEFYLAVALLEALARLDHDLVCDDSLQLLATSPEFAVRSCAANLLWDLALTNPGKVPLGLLGRLIEPSLEDWYVYAPAMAAAKELLLVRPQTRSVFAHILQSENAEDRSVTASALIEVARVNPEVVPPVFASILVGDTDEDVAKQGAVLQMILEGAGQRNSRIANFGL